MNEYREKFEELREKNTFRGEQWFGERKELVEEYGWAIPNEDAITYLAAFDELLEVGAGRGYWASLIEEHGGSVEATDAAPPESTYTEVERAGVGGLTDEIRDEPVLMIWPPAGNSMARHVARAEPSHILYVGELSGGCTATDTFFSLLNKKYGAVANIEIPSFINVDDNLYHYARKR